MCHVTFIHGPFCYVYLLFKTIAVTNNSICPNPIFFSSNFHIFDSNIFRSSEPTQGVVKLYVSKIPLDVTEVNHKLK